MPTRSPWFANQAPTVGDLTDYDHEHLIARWAEVARIMLHLIRPVNPRGCEAPATHPFGDPYLPTRVKAAPSGSAWLHEIKHDGYRLMVRRTDDGVRIKTRRGYDWTGCFPLVIEAAERSARRRGRAWPRSFRRSSACGLASRSKLLAKLLRRWLDGIQAA